MVIRAGVIGHPIAHSLSPRIHNYWFEQTGLEGHYEAVEASPTDFDRVVRQLAADGWAGLNVTYPHKSAAFALADHQNDAAQHYEAANVLVFRHGKIIADNTDAKGFEHSLYPTSDEQDDARAQGKRPRIYFMRAKERRAVLLGAGGAAAAALKSFGGFGEVVIINRNQDKARHLLRHYPDRFRAAPWEDLPSLLPETYFLANCTSLGMEGEAPLGIDISAMPEDAGVVDIVYNPLETDLLRQAKAKGLWHRNGLHMLVEQAKPSFEMFTGVDMIETESILKMLKAELA